MNDYADKMLVDKVLELEEGLEMLMKTLQVHEECIQLLTKHVGDHALHILKEREKNHDDLH